jgi:hypothetical protein
VASTGLKELNLRDVDKYSSPDEFGEIVTGSDGVDGYVPRPTPVIDRNGKVSEEFETVYNEDGTVSETRLKEGAEQRIADDLVRNDNRTRFGVNLAVADEKDSNGNSVLSQIKFISGSSGSMQGAVAYIEYWSKGGTSQKVPTSNPSSDVPTSKIEETNAAISELTDPRPPQPLPELNVPQQAEEPQSVPTQNVPVNTNSRPATGRGELLERNRQRARRNTSPEAGKVYKANPGAAPSPTQSEPETVIPEEKLQGRWQFLFNPEEIQLESGPEYNKAETWGVSDPKNSGQPLSWRSNKNRKLTFGKVLLTGYVIGKRVDSLEKGLQELFMARDGENGADGPPVLNFVWGARVFERCVIQNVRVLEKAWDYGLLVNAEVSFELEQVPEWTINDGDVDITSPGRQPVLNDPLISTTTEEEESAGTQPPPVTPPGLSGTDGGGGGQSRATALNKKQCLNLNQDFKAFDSLSKDIDTAIKIAKVKESKRIIPFFSPVYFYTRQYEEKVKRYKPLIINLVKNSFYAPQLRTNGTTNLPLSCREVGITNKLESYNEKVKKALSSSKSDKEKQENIKNIDIDFLRELEQCTNKAKNFPKSLLDSAKCKDIVKA